MTREEKLLLTFLLLFVGCTLSWFQSSLQLFWEWWGDRQLLITLILAIPCSLMYVYATKYGYEATQSLWSVRFLSFGISYLVFPVLTWALMDESPFTWKTITCTVLSVVIVVVQMQGLPE
jgi:hypothetical protein